MKNTTCKQQQQKEKRKLRRPTLGNPQVRRLSYSLTHTLSLSLWHTHTRTQSTHSRTQSTHSRTLCDCVTMKKKKVGQKETGKKGLMMPKQYVQASMSCHVPVSVSQLSLCLSSQYYHIASPCKSIPARLPYPSLPCTISTSSAFFLLLPCLEFLFFNRFPGMCVRIAKSDLHL